MECAVHQSSIVVTFHLVRLLTLIPPNLILSLIQKLDAPLVNGYSFLKSKNFYCHQQAFQLYQQNDSLQPN